jgi:hypothetical protein
MSTKLFLHHFELVSDSQRFWPVNIHANSVSISRDATYYCRFASVKGCFENLELLVEKKRVHINCQATIVPGITGWHTMAISVPLRIADNKIPAERESIAEWTRDLVNKASQASLNLACREGPLLLERHQNARAAAAYYLGKIHASLRKIQSYRDDLMLSATGHQRELARKSLTPALLCTRGKGQEFEDEAMAVYQTIALTITLDKDGERLGFFAPGTSPLERQIVACLYSDNGELPVQRKRH